MFLNHIIRVLTVGDSLSFRAVLQNTLLKDQGMSAVGTAGSAVETAKKIQGLLPDVVTMDMEISDVKDTDLLKRLIPRRPIPAVPASSLDLDIPDALDAGAIDLIRKPTARTGYNLFFIELVIRTQIVPTAKTKAEVPSPLDFLPTPAPSSSNKGEKVIVIGVSTGGTEATLETLKKLPANIPGTLAVQHMLPGFTKMYAKRLDRLYNSSVVEAQGGERVEPDRAYTVPGDKHMIPAKNFRGYYIKCTAGEKVNGHCPSVDVLFRSVAKTTGRDAMRTILTGMDNDGAKGLLEMRRQGPFIVGQDKALYVVCGMPMVAFDIDTVVRQVPCPFIAGITIQHLNQAK